MSAWAVDDHPTYLRKPMQQGDSLSGLDHLLAGWFVKMRDVMASRIINLGLSR